MQHDTFVVIFEIKSYHGGVVEPMILIGGSRYQCTVDSQKATTLLFDVDWAQEFNLPSSRHERRTVMCEAVLKRVGYAPPKGEVESTTDLTADDLVQAAFIREPDTGEADHGLCEVCTFIDFEAMSCTDSYPSAEEYTVLIRRQPANLFHSDCPICKIFARIMAQWTPSDGLPGFLIRALVYSGRVDVEVGPIPDSKDANDNYLWDGILLETYDRRAVEAARDATKGTENDSSLLRLQSTNQVDFAWLAAEIQHCVREHNHPPPEVSDQGDGSILVINCIKGQVARIGSHADYLCLSYVWGHGPPEDMTEDPYVDCGRLRQVSATIEDAIKVVLKLGERYLWVDRYCISQLDPVAKATEMEAMPWIFAGAKATIVALGPDDESGLQGVSTSRNASPHTYTPQGRPFHVYDRTIDEVDSSSWTTRAWTLQEAFLAKRLIFFLSSETVFVCKTSTLSQVGSRVTRQGEQELRSWQPKYVDYHTALDAYTKRALTYESDSLAAFCGFLNAFKEPCYWGVSTSLSMALLNDLADSDPLEAGFVENLQWSHYASRQEYGPMLTHRPLYLSAPTWSWVSYRLGAMAPNPKMDGTSYTIQGCSVRFWREDVRWCSAREFFAVRREPQLVLEPGLKSILLTGIHSLFEAGSKGLYGWTCRSSAKSPTFELLAFDDQHAEYWPEIRESINLENFDETYTFMPRIEAVLIAVHENKTHHAITQETYSSFWLTLEVGEKRDDGIIPATRTGSIQATLGCVSRVEVKELLASLDAARRVYELS